MRLPELSSDLDDSDNLLPVSGNGGGFSSIRLCGVLDDFGRLGCGSSILMDFFPFTVALGMKDFLRSFLDKTWTGSGGGGMRSSSPERLRRENILDCFLGIGFKSAVAGAVVMISGARGTGGAESSA